MTGPEWPRNNVYDFFPSSGRDELTVTTDSSSSRIFADGKKSKWKSSVKYKTKGRNGLIVNYISWKEELIDSKLNQDSNVELTSVVTVQLILTTRYFFWVITPLRYIWTQYTYFHFQDCKLLELLRFLDIASSQEIMYFLNPFLLVMHSIVCDYKTLEINKARL